MKIIANKCVKQYCFTRLSEISIFLQKCFSEKQRGWGVIFRSSPRHAQNETLQPPAITAVKDLHESGTENRIAKNFDFSTYIDFYDIDENYKQR